jgi:hypothetical protein
MLSCLPHADVRCSCCPESAAQDKNNSAPLKVQPGIGGEARAYLRFLVSSSGF